MGARKTAAVPEDEGKQPLFTVDFNDIITRGKMSGREIREFERIQPTRYMNVMKAFQSDDVPYDMFLGMVYILRRRQDPTVSFDDILDLSEDDFEVVGIEVEGDDAEVAADPTAEPEGETLTGS